MLVNNPIIRGFYPDPSICKANGTYYLVCSSFQYFPGVPLFESADLVHWKQIGHCLTRKSQVNLYQVPSSGCIFAPGIRYHEGRFYMVTTNSSFQQNFYVYTDDIYGEWSEPIILEQGGIDPSLYFENGKTYFTSNGSDEDGADCIYQCEIDIATGKKLTESIPVWKGFGGRYLEGPHLYKFGEYYYLIAAEGGTEYGHMMTYARSHSPFGPFEPYDANPVLTNRNLGGYTLQGIGHCDMIQDDNGNSWIVCLGFRQTGKWLPYHHLGREVCLVPVIWDTDGWFEAGDKGTVRLEMELPVPATNIKQNFSRTLTFASLQKNPLDWCYLRTPNAAHYEFYQDRLKLLGTSITLNEADSPTFVGVRQSEFHMDLSCHVKPNESEAGITLYMDESHHYDIGVSKKADQTTVLLRLCIGDVKSIVFSKCFSPNAGSGEDADNVMIKVRSDELRYYFYFEKDGVNIPMGSAQTRYLSSEVAGGFTGVIIGMYAFSKDCCQTSNTITNNWSIFSNLHLFFKK